MYVEAEHRWIPEVNFSPQDISKQALNLIAVQGFSTGQIICSILTPTFGQNDSGCSADISHINEICARIPNRNNDFIPFTDLLPVYCIKVLHKENKAQKSTERIMEKFGISHLKNRTPHHLSTGEKKKVALLGLLVCEPELLLFDEPTANLDQPGTKELLNIIKHLNSTIIISTHNPQLPIHIQPHRLVKL